MKMKHLKLFLVVMTIGYNTLMTFSQCEWNPVCLSYCSDVWDEAGSSTTCFDPTTTSFENPAQLNYCFKQQSEVFVQAISPTDGLPFIRRRNPIFHVCIPENICQLSFSLGEVEKVNGNETITQMESDNSVFTGTNRVTFCNECENNRYFTLSSHREISESNGTYKMNLTYTCCDKEGNITGTNTTSFYYQLIDATSEVDVDLSFTATQTIETLNGDNDIDGIIFTDGSFPGPELGPSSAGVRIATVGNGIEEYTVELYEVDCLDPTVESLVHSQVIPYQGMQSIQYSFLNIPNWSSIVDPDACYKVKVTVKSICGEYTDEAYFGITNTCIFCRILGPQQEEELAIGPLETLVVDHGGGSLEIRAKDVKIREIHVIDMSGRVYLSQSDIGENHISLTDIPEQFPLIIIIDEWGRINKKMLLRP